MKKILYFILGLVVAIALVITFAFDIVGKKYAAEYAQKTLNTPVLINEFSSSFFDKTLNIGSVEVQNPPGFNNKNAFSLESFYIKISDETNKDLIIVDELSLDGINFVLEQSDSGINLSTMLDNLEKSSNESSTDSDSSSADEKRVKINTFKVNDINLKVDTKLFEGDIEVPNININNFGGESGVLISQASKEIVKSILDELQEGLTKQVVGFSKEKIKELGAKIEEGKEKIKELGNKPDGSEEKIKELGDKIEEGTAEIKNKTKDLFKKLGF